MSQSTSDIDSGQKKSLFEKISEIIIDLISNIPTSSEPYSDDPKKRAKIIVLQASSKAALVSGGLSLPLGPIGMLTILPDIMAIWHIQRQMVADIASIYGKSKQLGKEEMLYCLFKHLASQVLRDVVVRVGERMLVRRTSLKFIQEILKKIGVRITQRIAGRGISRWIPIVGAIGIGAYAFYDTAQVGETAIDLFEREIDTEEGGS
jgi:hypothetical protein